MEDASRHKADRLTNGQRVSFLRRDESADASSGQLRWNEGIWADVREARALGAPKYLVARMLGNVALDGVVGLVPFAGDAFDVMFRANMRNMRILRKWMDKQPRA